MIDDDKPDQAMEWYADAGGLISLLERDSYELQYRRESGRLLEQAAVDSTKATSARRAEGTKQR